jgi:hypothetical protein
MQSLLALLLSSALVSAAPAELFTRTCHGSGVGWRGQEDFVRDEVENFCNNNYDPKFDYIGQIKTGCFNFPDGKARIQVAITLDAQISGGFSDRIVEMPKNVCIEKLQTEVGGCSRGGVRSYEYGGLSWTFS